MDQQGKRWRSMLDLSATRMTDQCQTDHKLESQNCYESEKNKGKYGVGLGGGGFRGPVVV